MRLEIIDEKLTFVFEEVSEIEMLNYRTVENSFVDTNGAITKIVSIKKEDNVYSQL